jgi:hypothetical protein
MRKHIAWWHAGRARARSDAADMVLRYRDGAHAVATRLARAERRGRIVDILLPPGHWARVCREIRRLRRARSEAAT